MSRKQRIGLILGLVLPAIILLVPGDLDLQPRIALAISAFTVLFWTFEPAPIEYTSLLMLLLFPLLGVIPFETTFSAFSGKAVWLVFSGMALSLGITETPLSARAARLFLGRVATYPRLILSLHLLGVVMALLVPSGVVRVLILMPVLVSLLKTLDEPPGSPVSAALILSLVCATYYSGTGVLTASVPNLVVLGVLESRGLSIYWAEWAIALFPVVGLLRTACCYVLIRLLLPVPHALPTRQLEPSDPGIPETVSPAEKKILGILFFGIALWATDSLHGIHPAYIGLTLALICYLPGWGPLSPAKLKQINFPILIYIAAVFAIGHALEHTGFNTRLAGVLTGWFDLSQSDPLLSLGAISCMVVPFDFLMDTAAVGGVLTPVFLDLGARIGLPPSPVALSVAIGTGMVFIPYQSAPFLIAYSFRRVRMGQFILLMSLLSLLTLLLLLPLTLLYWRLIGIV